MLIIDVYTLPYAEIVAFVYLKVTDARRDRGGTVSRRGLAAYFCHVDRIKVKVEYY